MEKINFDLSKSEPETQFSFDDKIVKVKRWINMTNRNVILNAYFASYSEDVIESNITSQYGLILAVLDVLTNVDIKDISIDELVDSGLWHKISAEIVNLDSVYDDITAIKKELARRQSAESKLVKLLDSIQGFIEKISAVDLSKDGIAELLKNFDQVKSEIGKFYPVVNDVEIEKELPKTTRKKKKGEETTS